MGDGGPHPRFLQGLQHFVAWCLGLLTVFFCCGNSTRTGESRRIMTYNVSLYMLPVPFQRLLVDCFGLGYSRFLHALLTCCKSWCFGGLSKLPRMPPSTSTVQKPSTEPHSGHATRRVWWSRLPWSSTLNSLGIGTVSRLLARRHAAGLDTLLHRRAAVYRFTPKGTANHTCIDGQRFALIVFVGRWHPKLKRYLHLIAIWNCHYR
jgi:hypothetical protein